MDLLEFFLVFICHHQVWDINFLQETYAMTGMENAVTAAAISSTTVVTTSTGMKDASDGVTGYCVRLWRNGQAVKTCRFHYASIRCCSPFYLHEVSATEYPGEADGFVTGANDGKLIIYDPSGEKIDSCETPPNVVLIADSKLQGEGKYPFIMKVKSLCTTGSIHDCLFFSVSEDSNARVWKYSSLQQVICHPNSVWDIDYMEEDGYLKLITACSDGVYLVVVTYVQIVRVFHTDPKKWLSEDLRV